MTRARIRRRGTGIVGMLALTATVAACGAGSNATSAGGNGGTIVNGPGVDVATKTITLGVITPLSGPAAVIGKPLTLGEEVYFKHLNDNGGIDGWKVNLTEKDDQYNPQTHASLYQQILPSVAFIAQSLGSPTTLAIQQQADQGKVVIGAATQSSSWLYDPVMSVVGTPYAADEANGVDYIVNQLGKKDAKIGIVFQNDDYGQSGLQGYLAAVNKYHFNDVGHEAFNATDKSFTAQVQDLKAKGAEYVFVVALPKSAATLVGTGYAIQYSPQWVFEGPAFSEYLLTDKGDASGTPTKVAPLLKGTWVLGYLGAWGDTSLAGMTQFLADHDKYAATQVPDGYYEYGYAFAQVEAAFLKKAIEANDLTRTGILNAKENLGSVSLGGLLPDVNYTTSLGPVSLASSISAIDPTATGFLKPLVKAFISDAAKSIDFKATLPTS